MHPENGMAGLMRDVAAFHTAADLPINTEPQIVEQRLSLRAHLLAEECVEFLNACKSKNIVQMADGLADIVYVAVGAALEFGIPLDRVWAEVQRSNMAKIDPVTRKVIKRADGKVLKPEGWRPPNITGAVFGGPTVW